MGDVFMGGYASAGLLGRGKMGAVYRARPLDQSGQDVVVKVMMPQIASQARFRQLFAREIQSMARLRHPYIVRLLDFSLDDPHGPCLVMEHIPGITLEELLSNEVRLSAGRAGLLLGSLCHALEFAHSLGIIHLDLKPANLMIVGAGTLDESLRVMDFGLSCLASKPHFTAERLAGGSQNFAQGTPCYICPEQLRGDELDGRSDLYSVGVILFEMLTGQLPFPHHDVDKILCAHVYDEPMSIAQTGVRDLPPALEQVVQLCLRKYGAERPASARELARLYSEALGIDIWEAAQPEQAPHLVTPLPEAKPELPADRNAIVHHLDAWMPERIAVVKLRGFLEEIGGKVVESEPGLLRIRLGELDKAAFTSRRKFITPNTPKSLPIEIEMRMEKPDPRANLLNVTVLFRPFTDPVLFMVPDWRKRCENLYKDLQSYLMAR